MTNKQWGGGAGRKHGSCSQGILFTGTNSLLFIAITRAGIWLVISNKIISVSRKRRNMSSSFIDCKKTNKKNWMKMVLEKTNTIYLETLTLCRQNYIHCCEGGLK